VQEVRSLHPRAKIRQEDASSVEARIILFLNAHTIVTMMMMTIRTRRRTRRKRRYDLQEEEEEEEGWFICGHLG
jgi:hypothetical protein